MVVLVGLQSVGTVVTEANDASRAACVPPLDGIPVDRADKIMCSVGEILLIHCILIVAKKMVTLRHE